MSCELSSSIFVFFAFFGKMFELNGASDLPIPPIIALFAPFHLPGPTSLYCDGKQGPNRQCRASFGSCLKIVVMSGLHPICFAISSIYSIQNVCKDIT